VTEVSKQKPEKGFIHEEPVNIPSQELVDKQGIVLLKSKEGKVGFGCSFV